MEKIEMERSQKEKYSKQRGIEKKRGVKTMRRQKKEVSKFRGVKMKRC